MKPLKLVFKNTTKRKKTVNVSPLICHSVIYVFNEKSVKGTKKGMTFIVKNISRTGMVTTTPVVITPVKTKMAVNVRIAFDACTDISAEIPAKSKITLVCKPDKTPTKPTFS